MKTLLVSILMYASMYALAYAGEKSTTINANGTITEQEVKGKTEVQTELDNIKRDRADTLARRDQAQKLVDELNAQIQAYNASIASKQGVIDEIAVQVVTP